MNNADRREAWRKMLRRLTRSSRVQVVPGNIEVANADWAIPLEDFAELTTLVLKFSDEEKRK